MFCFFGPEACGILAPPQGIEPTPPALEGEILTTDLQGSPMDAIYILIILEGLFGTIYVVDIHTPSESVIPLLGMYPIEMHAAYVYQNAGT